MDFTTTLKLIRPIHCKRSKIEAGSVVIAPQAGGESLVEGKDYEIDLASGDITPLRDFGRELYVVTGRCENPADKVREALDAAAQETEEVLAWVDSFEKVVQADAVGPELRKQADLTLCAIIRRWIPIGQRETGGV